MNKELEKLRKEMTKEEFIDLLNENRKCPSTYWLTHFELPKCKDEIETCTQCWREAIKYIKFKDDGIEGLGKEAEKTINEQGGKQSKVNYRFDLADAKAMFKLCKVLSEGAEEYGENNWRNISVEDNLNHALIHIYGYFAGDKQDEHLSHALCRLLFAVALEEE